MPKWKKITIYFYCNNQLCRSRTT